MFNEKYLTVYQVAEYLGISNSTVYKNLIKKEIPAVKIGRQWRIPKSRLENWINKKLNEIRGN